MSMLLKNISVQAVTSAKQSMMHHIEIALTLSIMKVRSSHESLHYLLSERLTFRYLFVGDKTTDSTNIVLMSSMKQLFLRIIKGKHTKMTLFKNVE